MKKCPVPKTVRNVRDTRTCQKANALALDNGL